MTKATVGLLRGPAAVAPIVVLDVLKALRRSGSREHATGHSDRPVLP